MFWGPMENKVYEGYKKTSTSKRTTTAKSSTTGSIVSGESKTPKARSTRKSTSSKPRIALFIDVDNVGITRENLLEILFYVNGKYQIEQCRLYGFSDETLPGIRDIATEYNMTTIGKMKFKQAGTNCLDSRLLIDAYECADNNRQKIDMLFVWCYPCDLAEFFEKITALGVNTATIEHEAFDCKNKFVSQTFKLYSQYDFNVEQSSYGKIRNNPSTISPIENIEKTVSTISVNNEEQTETIPQTVQETTNESRLSIFDEGAVPPVLPRRTILERSTPNAPKPVEVEEQPEVVESEESSSLVDDIARKLNLTVPTKEDLDLETARMEREFDEEENMKNSFIQELLSKTGLSDYIEGKKSDKYEDTIGDL